MAGVTAASSRRVEGVSHDPERDRQLASILEQIKPETLGPVFAVLMAGGDPGETRRAEIGVIARRTEIPEDGFIELTRRYTPDVSWPRSLVITAVDVDDGAFAWWGVDAGIPLVRAVAASSALPGIFPPITIAGRRYMDGAMRSPTSADLAIGSDVVVIVAAPSRSEQSDRQIAAETATIRAAGGEIVEIRPDAESSTAFGPDPMDSNRQSLVFEAGLRQGSAWAGDIASRIG